MSKESVGDKALEYIEAAAEKIASWRIKIGQGGKMEIWVHYSLGVVGLGLLAFPVYECLKQWSEWKYDFFYLWIGCSLALAVLAHEIGHVAIAKVLGCRKAAIVFHALGGIAFFDRESFSAKPWKLLLVCASGPLVNLALACLACCWMDHESKDIQLMLEIFRDMNSILLLNLLPLYPLDGGRIFKAFMEILGISKKIYWKLIMCCSCIGYIGLLWFWITISEWLGVAELVILAPLLGWITWEDFKSTQL